MQAMPRLRRFEMEQFNISMRKYLKEVGVTAQQAIERVVREEKLAGKGKLKVKMVLTGEGTGLRHVVEGEIDLADFATRRLLLLPLAPSSASMPRFNRSLPHRAFIAVFPLRDLILIGIQIPQFSNA
jgi:hypothetical protein